MADRIRVASVILGSLPRRERLVSFGARRRLARSGEFDLRFEAEFASAHRSDIHEEAFVKTGARRARDFPEIHSASAATATRHEKLYGCPHSHQRRRSAPCRTQGAT